METINESNIKWDKASQKITALLKLIFLFFFKQMEVVKYRDLRAWFYQQAAPVTCLHKCAIKHITEASKGSVLAGRMTSVGAGLPAGWQWGVGKKGGGIKGQNGAGEGSQGAVQIQEKARDSRRGCCRILSPLSALHGLLGSAPAK